jgi:hypothetical protein
MYYRYQEKERLLDASYFSVCSSGVASLMVVLSVSAIWGK